jgi:hypothetical protein
MPTHARTPTNRLPPRRPEKVAASMNDQMHNARIGSPRNSLSARPSSLHSACTPRGDEDHRDTARTPGNAKPLFR